MPRISKLVLAVAALAVAVAPGARANHSSGYYEQPLWFQWNKAGLDVLIVPPNHGQIYNSNGVLNGGDPNELNPYANSYLRAIEDSIADYKRAIAEYGEPWLVSGVRIAVYVIGRDDIPPEVATGAEIVIVTDEHQGTGLGVAINTRPCIVDNAKFFTRSFNYYDMFSINAQEFGHCLGLDHVHGDAQGTKAKGYTDGDLHDPMNGLYPHTPGSAGTDLHCVSNLNVMGLHEVFRATLGMGPASGLARVRIADYVRPATCGPGAA